MDVAVRYRERLIARRAMAAGLITGREYRLPSLFNGYWTDTTGKKIRRI